MQRFVFIALFAAGPALAQSPQGDVAVTIYNNDLALVQDIRQIDIPAGRSRQEFADVSGQIRAETVSFAAADTGDRRAEFRLRPAFAGQADGEGGRPDGDHRPGQPGHRRRSCASRPRCSPPTAESSSRSATRIEVLRDDGLPVRVIFDKVPENLRARPTLSVTLESRRAGVRPARLTYLTPGLGWKSDYVALFDEAAGKIDVQGWITLTNSSGTSYANADVLMVAGSAEQRQQL